MRSMALALCLLLAALPLRAVQAPEWFRVFSAPARASALLGMAVRDARGDPVGVLSDLVLDLERNRVHRALVRSGARQAQYPMHALKLRQGHIVLEGDETTRPAAAPRLRASAVLGAPVWTQAGSRYGTLSDMVLDAFWGNVAFAVIDSGGRLRAVPLDALRARTQAAGLELRIDEEKLAALEGFSAEELAANLANTEFLQRHARLAHRLTPRR
jgi:sporulation protein YlmC with PRC-barrel domain